MSQMEKSVLIVDDDEKLRKLLGEYLSGYAFSVRFLEDGSREMEEIRREAPDMVILDVMLPDRDGFDILRDIRGVSRVPVIMLTAKGEDADRIVGLELGADDYLPKPFNPRELLARIRAVLRRQGGDVEDAEEAKTYRVGDLVLNTARLTLSVGDEASELSTTECRLLAALMGRPDRALSRERIMTMVWGRDYAAFDRTIDVHISRLRAKLGKYPEHAGRIKTVWGAGYMFLSDV